jgi:Zn-dependent M28 family amino/carboxypeptidase
MERMARVPGGRERAASPAAQVLADSERHIPVFTVSDAVAAELLSVTGKKPRALQAAIDATLKPASQSLPGVSAEMEVEVAESRRAATANVVGMLEGSDPKLRAEAVVFGGHYDHLGMRGGQVLPGADDDASGTAAVIELARVFASGTERPRRTLVFVAFGAEEAGLLGSYYYALRPARPLERTRAVFSLDMIGRDEKPSPQTAGLIDIAEDSSNEVNFIGLKASPSLRAVLEQANREVGLRLNGKWDDDAALNILFRSDHFPFLLQGVPAVWVFNGFTPDYHQPADTIDKLNFPKMEKIVRLVYLAGGALAHE